MSDATGLPGGPRCVGIDYGAKRVGIAVADPLRLFAQPLGTFSPTEAVRALVDLDASDGVALAVVGWPLLPDGQEGTATEAVDRFIRRISKALPGTEIIKWDERYTSALAAEKIREAGPNRRWKRTRGRIDTAAAAIILQEYLDDAAAKSDASK